MKVPVYGYEDMYYIDEQGVIINKSGETKKPARNASARQKRYRLLGKYEDGIYLTYKSFYPEEDISDKELVPIDGDWYNSNLNNIKVCSTSEDLSKILTKKYGQYFKQIQEVRGHVFIGDGGTVISLLNKTPKILKPFLRQDGYYQHTLTNIHGDRQRFKVHRLVGQYFVSNPHNLQTINHKDGDKKNNKANNLEWCTLEYNVKDELQRNQVMKPCAVLDTRDNHIIQVFDSIADASREYQVDSSVASRQCRGKANCFYSKKIKMRLYNKETGNITYTRFD